jgi:hypothetical protein
MSLLAQPEIDNCPSEVAIEIQDSFANKRQREYLSFGVIRLGELDSQTIRSSKSYYHGCSGFAEQELGLVDLSELKKFFTRIEEIAQYEENWDSYGAPTPNEWAEDNCRSLVIQLFENSIVIRRILPNADGGFILELETLDSMSGFIEIYNDKTVSYCVEDVKTGVMTGDEIKKCGNELHLANFLNHYKHALHVSPHTVQTPHQW